MKIACVGDRLSLLGMGLAGVKRLVIVEEGEDARDKIKELASADEYGLVLVTSNIYSQVEETVRELEAAASLPVFLQIPEMRLLVGVREVE
ncbi:MAG: V-type ATP synthase subunit F [Candidatus Bathyarchaeota archaeon]